MDIKEEHKKLLKSLGLKDEDFKHFDGKDVSYEYDENKGVRLYDPDYVTSYDEYISVDGWSSWSSEEDTFMSDILKDVRERAEEKEKPGNKSAQEEIEKSLKAKFDKTAKSDTK